VKFGISDPNSQGYQIGSLGADVFTVYTIFDTASSRPARQPSQILWQDLLSDAQGQVSAKQAEFGNVVNDVLGMDSSKPPLQRIHPNETYVSDPDAANSLQYQRSRTTEDLIRSLEPNPTDPAQGESLKTYPDGRLLNGNTRIRVLQERGVDVNQLPRAVRYIDPLTGDETWKIVK